MNLLTRKKVVDDVVDMLTDWFMEKNQEICCECCLNKKEEDIGYSSCPADFDLSECPNLEYDLLHEFSEIANRLYEILPEPEDEF